MELLIKPETVLDFYRDLPRLETERLVLRKAEMRDAPSIFAFASDSDVTRYLRWGPHKDLNQTVDYLEGMLAESVAGRDGSWVLSLKQTQTVIGQIHLMEIDVVDRKAQVGFVLAKEHWNQGLATEALREVLRYAFEHLGLNRVEALCGWPATDAGFAGVEGSVGAGSKPALPETGKRPSVGAGLPGSSEDHGINSRPAPTPRAIASTGEGINWAAIRVLEKAGMKKEGELRQYAFQKGEFWDFWIYAVVSEDYGIIRGG